MKHTVCFQMHRLPDILFQADEGMTLLEAGRLAGVDVDAPCSGNGTCGKCLVQIVSSGGAETGEWKRACQFKIKENLTVRVPSGQDEMIIVNIEDEREHKIFKQLKKEMADAGFSDGSGIEIITLEIKKPDIDDSMADRERVIRALVKAGITPEPEFSLYALRKLPEILRGGEIKSDSVINDNDLWSLACVLRRTYEKACVLDVMPVTSLRTRLPALAIDIGTTSVAAVLVDLQTEEAIASGSKGNTQIRYGADVINRIIESTRPGGLERLQKTLIDDCIVPLIKELAGKAEIETNQIYKAAIAANTTMTHLFTGVSPEHLRLEPYIPAFFHAGTLKAAELGLPVHPQAEVYLSPSVGSYVGGDISAGIFASMIFKKETKSVFVDLGTNGELVFGGQEFLMTCACSAGPAFEGGDISCGMRAAKGAVESVKIDRETFEPELKIIGGGKPAGICGSGLIDLAAELFSAGLIDPRGKFAIDKDSAKRIRKDEWGMTSYVLAFADETDSGSEVFLSEVDIDNFVRAKGAVFSAIKTMLNMLDFTIDAVDDVYIAGGIGSGINIEQAIRIGMLPDISKERYHYLGNTSLAGAYAMVCSQKAVREINRIADSMTYIELSTHPSYMNEFSAACFLPHTDSGLFR